MPNDPTPSDAIRALADLPQTSTGGAAVSGLEPTHQEPTEDAQEDLQAPEVDAADLTEQRPADDALKVLLEASGFTVGDRDPATVLDAYRRVATLRREQDQARLARLRMPTIPMSPRLH